MKGVGRQTHRHRHTHAHRRRERGSMERTCAREREAEKGKSCRVLMERSEMRTEAGTMLIFSRSYGGPHQGKTPLSQLFIPNLLD